MRTTEITVGYGDQVTQHDRGHGRLEFGRATERGIVVVPRDAALTDYVHGVCGWFSWDNGWSLHRRRGTTNISMHAHLGGRAVEVAPAASVLLGVGEGRVEMVLRGPRRARETLELHWLIPSTRASHTSTTWGGPSATETITDTFDDDPTQPVATISLAPREREVMAVFAAPLLEGGLATRTAGDVAEILFRDRSSTAPVDRAVTRVKDKVAVAQRELHEPVLTSRRGVRSSDLLARWLVDHGVITRADVDALARRV